MKFNKLHQDGETKKLHQSFTQNKKVIDLVWIQPISYMAFLGYHNPYQDNTNHESEGMIFPVFSPPNKQLLRYYKMQI